MRKVFTLFCVVVGISIVGCGGSSGGDDTTATASGDASTRAANTEFFGQGGNLWKPAAEEGASTAGLLVVLLSAEHTGRFDECELMQSDGSILALDCNDRVPWSHEPFSCVANGGREHWRATIRCDQAAEVRVTCRNATEVMTVEAAGTGIGAVCERHG